MAGGIVLDLHVHTTAGSADASLRAAALGAAARAVGVHGVLVTEHFRRWTEWEVRSVAEAQGIIVIPAREWSTPLGHVLAIGLSREEPELRDIERLRRAADEEGALLVAAHPFRHFFDPPRPGLHPAALRTEDPEEAATLPIFRYVDAVEVANGNCTARENAFAAAVAAVLGLPVTAGSDAHYADDLGRQVTVFRDAITSPAELIEAIRSGGQRVTAGPAPARHPVPPTR
jgi:predicted metal-dependent phosphoesterase TrpH